MHSPRVLEPGRRSPNEAHPDGVAAAAETAADTPPHRGAESDERTRGPEKPTAPRGPNGPEVAGEVQRMKFAHFEFDPQSDRLGEGPQSEVFRAVDTRLGRTVALKILRPNVLIDERAAERFEREARHTSSLAHGNIATIYEYGQDPKTEASFIAMEYLEGRTLDKIVKDGPLSFGEGTRIGLQVSSALAHVHRRGIVHRDLKPANIMVQEDGSVKLLDFGICRASNESNITQSGMLVGTVLYMSPEQVRGEEIDVRSDVFSLGSVLYHALTGALPFPGRSFPEVCMAILDGSPLPPSEQRTGLPQVLEEFLLRCLAREPGERFGTGEEAHGALLRAQDAMRAKTSSRKAASLRGTLVVPPLHVVNDTEHGRAFAGGLRRDLSSELSRSTQLKVELVDDVERSSSEEIGVMVLSGTLALDGSEGALEYTIGRANGAKLTDTTELWSDRVLAKDEDEWGLQAQLVGSIARTVKRRLSQATMETIKQSRRDPAKARAFANHAHTTLHKGTTKHLLSAISSFRRAMDLDPGCALAHAGLAEALARKYLYWDGDASFIDESEDMARRALSIDDECAEAHTSLGFAYHMTGRNADAQREYRLAIQLDRDEWLAHRLRGALLARTGNFKEASGLLRRATILRPTHLGSYDHLFNVLSRLDRYEEALALAETGIQVARAHLSKMPDDQEARLHLALLLGRMGSKEESRTAIEEAREFASKDGYTAFHSACVLCLLGELDEAMASLQEAQARGYYVQSELLRNSDLEVLRGRPEFEEMSA